MGNESTSAQKQLQTSPENAKENQNKFNNKVNDLSTHFGFGMSQHLTINDFTFLKVVGKGSFGKVMQVKKNDNGTIYALKVIKKKELLKRKQIAQNVASLTRKVLSEIDNPFIVSMRYVFQSDAKLYMVLDFFNGGELFFHLKNEGRFSQKRSKFYSAEIFLALKYIHSKDIIYMDLKPENILLDNDGHIKITDFSLSKDCIQNNSIVHIFSGSPEYLAPEIIQQQDKYNKSVDWWTFGTLLYEMLTGLPPFYNENVNIMCEKIINDPVPMPKYLSKEARSILLKLLQKNETDRLKSIEIEQHKFFKDINWDILYTKEIKPPFKPKIKDENDCANVDLEFTDEVPRDTLVDLTGSMLAAKDMFTGFTYSGSGYGGNDMNTIGLSIGGAKDVNNFRQCLGNHIMPSINSITYNGILYEYFFDTRSRKHIVKEEKINLNDESMLFYPTYCYAKTKKLVFSKEELKIENDNEREYYMTIGLNSNIKQNEFKRKHLNLIILWDKSGSMNSSFNSDNKNINIDIHGEWRGKLQINDKVNVKDGSGSWYDGKVVAVGDWYSKNKNKIKIHYIGFDNKYDEYVNKNSNRIAPYGSVNTKFSCSKMAINSILKQLTIKDRLGVITFNHNAYMLQEFDFVNKINMKELNTKIYDTVAEKGTNFEKGYKHSIEMYDKLQKSLNGMGDNEYDNRIIVLTDAQLNEGKKESDDILKIMQMNKFVYTTFIGVGLDFNVELISKISQLRGCNYHSVQNAEEFNDKMNEEFNFMVCPLVFNVSLKLKCEGNICEIEKVYGSNDDKVNDIMNNGEITKIHTLFPSKRSNKTGGVKGGLQLIKLKKKNNYDSNINIQLEVTFEDRYGKQFKNTQNVSFDPPKETVDNDMIEMDIDEKKKEELNINFYDNLGIRKAILLCKYVELIKTWIDNDAKKNGYFVGKSLKVSDEYKKIFANFEQHFKKEMIECNDNTLQKELDVINKLGNV